MTRAALRELAWIVGALAVSVTVVLATSKDAVRAARGASSHTATVIVDASGFRVAPRTFHRVASGSILADRLLIELSEPERIVGLSRYGRTDSAFPFHYASRRRSERRYRVVGRARTGPLVVEQFCRPATRRAAEGGRDRGF